MTSRIFSPADENDDSSNQRRRFDQRDERYSHLLRLNAGAHVAREEDQRMPANAAELGTTIQV